MGWSRRAAAYIHIFRIIKKAITVYSLLLMVFAKSQICLYVRTRIFLFETVYTCLYNFLAGPIHLTYYSVFMRGQSVGNRSWITCRQTLLGHWNEVFFDCPVCLHAEVLPCTVLLACIFGPRPKFDRYWSNRGIYICIQLYSCTATRKLQSRALNRRCFFFWCY